MTGPGNVWLYAVVAADRQPPEVSGVAGESLRVIEADGVAAVAGTVPRDDFDEQPLQAHLEDAAWLERTVRAHHHVVGVLARGGPALPLRFATLYRDDERVTAMLTSRQVDLLAALERIAGRAEWGIKLYLAPERPERPERLERPEVGSSGVNGPDVAAEDPHRGTAYLLRRKAQRDDREQALRRASVAAQQIHATLAATAVESTQHPLQSAEASGRHDPMVLNGAYLIDDSRQAVFDDAVDALVLDHPELRMEMTGPWPPYSFSGVGAWPVGS